MKKKGFTLVELLAVIAILAILVIMALPAVLRMYREARQTTFIEEVQGTYKLAQTRYVQDSIKNDANSFTYTNCTTNNNPLDMTTSSNFHYSITISGKDGVSNFKASNGSYSFTFTGPSLDFNPSDVKAGEGGNVTESATDICPSS